MFRALKLLKNICVVIIFSLSVFWVGEIMANNAMGETSSPTIQAPKSQDTNINKNAEKGQDSQSQGQMINAAASAALFAAYAASCSTSCNHSLAIMGAMAAMQAAQMGAAAGQSGAVFDATSFDPGSFNWDPGSFENNSEGYETQLANSKAQWAMDSLKGAGYTVMGDGTVMGPDGPIPAEAFNSVDGMVAAGIDPGSASTALATAREISEDLMSQHSIHLDQPNVISMDVDSGGGGGTAGGSGRAPSSAGGSSLDAYLASLNKPKTPQEKANMVAGKSINYGGTPIGVQADNIFEMIHRRYQILRANGEFIEDDVEENTRQPARQKHRPGL